MIRLIVAYDQRRGIAKHGVQPWNIPDDEAYFSLQTKSRGAAVFMGRKTLEVMGSPLDERDNYVLTSNDKSIAGVTLVHDTNEFLIAWGDKDLWVIGGASIYELFMKQKLADELYVTHIAADFGCDQFFPEFNENDYTQESKIATNSQNGFEYRYAVYIKK